MMESMNGLEAFTRESMASIRTGTSEMLSEGIRDSMHNNNADTQEKGWSWIFLREEFKKKEMDCLFEKYEARLRHSFFVVSLMLNISYCLGIIIIYLAAKKEDADITVPLALRFVSLALYIIFFVVSYREHLFRPQWVRILIASLVVVAMVCAEHGTALITLVSEIEDRRYSVRPTYFILLVIVVMLPFPRRYQSAIAFLLVLALELVVSCISHKEFKKTFARMVISDCVFYFMAGIVGLYITLLMEITNRRAFLDKWKCQESTFLLENEKGKEEDLLQSILPKHIAWKVRDDIRRVKLELDRNHHLPPRPFNELYVKRYTNVSILYADIVNSMLLTASLSAHDLVGTLNELFGKFDESAEKNNCMRIKLLGDCYYCVSGIPDPDKRHAINCVQMGLDMIEIIKVTKAEREVNVNMRIGVHTGNVLSGLLGLRKWQYDIWSRDVIIASRMEQSGKPGLVHISRATLDHLEGEFSVVPGNGQDRDDYLAQESVETFFIVPKSKEPQQNISSHAETNGHAGSKLYSTKARRPSVAAPVANRIQQVQRKSYGGEVLSSRRRTVFAETVRTFVQMRTIVKETMDSAIDKMALSKMDQWLHPEEIQPLFLHFGLKYPNFKIEKDYIRQPDPLFKYYLFCVLLMFIAMTVIHTLMMGPLTPFFWGTYISTFLIIFIGCLMTWTGYFYIWMKTSKRDSAMSLIVKRNKNIFSWAAKTVSNRAVVRVSFWFIISVLMLVCALGDSDECLQVVVRNNTASENVTTNSSANSNPPHSNTSTEFGCMHPWYYIFCVVLAMTATSVFLRINFVVKFLANLAALVYFWTVTRNQEKTAFERALIYYSEWNLLNFSPEIGHCFFLTLIFLTLHVLDRQIEYVCRLDYLSKRHLEEEREETSMVKLVNTILLQNILPKHVAQYYLNKEYRHSDDIYNESYENVAVMFASIPNFSMFYTENTMNDEGLECLKFLNEIICEFDRLLFLPVFSKVEKIKTIGSTYMAAVGLQPGRGSSDSLNSFVRENPLSNVMTIVKFAEALMEYLRDTNRHGFQHFSQDFSLRIGIAIGPVIAGVVGENKPQYDIWGDTVNVASRMDSTGIIGRIHVTEQVAKLLMNEGSYPCECRGEIFVKGKGLLTTYLVQTPFDEPSVEITHI